MTDPSSNFQDRAQLPAFEKINEYPHSEFKPIGSGSQCLIIFLERGFSPTWSLMPIIQIWGCQSSYSSIQKFHSDQRNKKKKKITLHNLFSYAKQLEPKTKYITDITSQPWLVQVQVTSISNISIRDPVKWFASCFLVNRWTSYFQMSNSQHLHNEV